MVLSAFGLMLLSPLMGLIALLVKLTSPGPIFYRQPRCGLNGRTFQHAEVSQHARRCRAADGGGVGAKTTTGGRGWARFSARRVSMSCRSSGTC